MNEFVIDLVGQLNMSATVKNIKTDLQELSKTLNQSGNERIELVGRLDPGETTKVLQNQLNLISQTLKLEIKSDGLNSVIESLAKIGKELSGLNVQQGVARMFEATTDAIEATDNALGKLTQTTYRYHGAERELTDWTEVHKNGFTTTSITSAWGEDEEGNKRQEEQSRQVIANYQERDRAIQKATNSAEKYNEQLTRTFKLITDSNSSQYIKNTQAQGEAFDRILDISAKVKSLGSITDAEQFTKQKMAIDADIQSLNDYLSVQRNIETQQKQSEKAAFNLTEQLAKLQSKYTDANSSKAITNTDNLDKLKDAAAEATTKIEALKNANSQTFTELDREAKKAVNNYDLMASAMQKAETMATKLKAKPVSVVKAEALNELNEFEAGLRRLGISFDETITRFDGTVQPLRAAIQELRTEFDQVGNSQQKLTDFSYLFGEIETRVNEFKRQKGFFDNINSEIEKAGKDLDALQSKLSGSKFSNSPGIHDLTEQLTQLRTEYDALKAALADKDPQAMDQMASEVKQNADAIKKKITEIDNAVRQFEKSANNAANSDLLSGKKKVLSNNIEIWLKNNTKASESTRAALRRLQEQIESADKTQLRNLSQQFVEIKKNAEAAGETGKKFLDVFKQNISKFTSWYGIGNIVATISREIRQAISDLREMDTVLTEISKTSDRTEQELEQLGQASFDTASKYGITAIDYLKGVQEMSRAGYQNSEQMAELAILAQSAGDMAAQTAQDYLMATDAAYQLGGSEEKLTQILDSQNMVTNRWAVSMTDMASATKEAASMAHNYGVSIEELTGLITVATAKTRESGTETGNALNSLFVNLSNISNKAIVKAFDQIGVSMRKIEGDSVRLKTPIELMKELSEVFNEAPEGSDTRAIILNKIGGKHYSNTLAAILQGWDDFEKVLNDYNDGIGSAAREAEKSANSWEGSVNKFTNSFTKLVNNFVTSGSAEKLIGILSGIVGMADKFISAFGGMGSAVGIFAGIMLSKQKAIHFSFDEETRSIKFGTKAMGEFTSATLKQGIATIGLKAKTLLFNTVLNIGLTAAISGIVYLFDSWIHEEEQLQQEHEEMIQKLQETSDKYKEAANNAANYLTTYKEILAKDEITQEDREKLLEMQNSILDTYGQQAEGIDLVNGKYQEQLDILAQIAGVEYEKALPNVIDLIKEVGEKAGEQSTDNVISYTNAAYRREIRVNDEQKELADWWKLTEEQYDKTRQSAEQYLNILEDIDGFSKRSEWSNGNETQIVDFDKNLPNSQKIDAITEALHRLNTETTAEQKNTPAYEALTQHLKDLLNGYEEYAKTIADNVETLIKGVSPADIGTNVNWANVTDETFKEWYDAIVSYYNSDRFGKDYQDAVIDWFDRNYTSVAQRIARGTTVAEIAYESEQAWKKRIESSDVFEFDYGAYAEDVTNVTTEIDKLQKVIDKIDSGKYSTIKDGFGLLDTYPELLNVISYPDRLKEKLIELQKAAPRDLIDELLELRENLQKTGNTQQIQQIDNLITALQRTDEVVEEITEDTEKMTVKDLEKMQTDSIDQIVDKLGKEKDELKDTLDLLKEHKETIEDTYDKQIAALKKENEERENNIKLQEKQQALEKAKRDKVIVYSAVRGRTIQEDTSAITKAQQELDDVLTDQQVSQLESKKDAEISTVEEQISAQEKLIKAKEDEIDIWKEYKDTLKSATDEISATNNDYLEAQKQFVLDENSTMEDRVANLKNYLIAVQNLVNGAAWDNGLSETDEVLNKHTSWIFGSTFDKDMELKRQDFKNLMQTEYINQLAKSGGNTLDTTKNNGTSVFSPNTTVNITANKVDEGIVEGIIERYVLEQYNKKVVGQ